MQFKIKEISKKRESSKEIFVSEDSASALGIFFGDLVKLKQDKKEISVVALKSNISYGEVEMSPEFIKEHGILKNKPIILSKAKEPESLKFILKKLGGEKLSEKEFFSIVKDINSESLSEAAIAYFVSGVSKNGLSVQETVSLTKAMAYSGDKLNWGSKIVVDKHCVGGIPGNRTTPIVVSICAAAGLTMPKTSSRAITSAAGTADSMEVLTQVSLPTNRLKKIVKETGACLAWGGALGLAPADDLLIHVERKLNLDPMPQIVASILSKKLAAGSTHVLIDIPMGKGAKVSNSEGKQLAKMFKVIGSKFNLKLKTVFTDGTKPVGQGVGPVLEIRDVLSVLKQDRIISDLESKAIFLSGEILELSGKAKKGKGVNLASEILKSGSAFMKFKEIISAQGEVSTPNLSPGPISFKVKATKSGKLIWHNQEINNLAKALGCPEHKRAGVFLDLPHFSKINKGEVICTLYAQDKSHLNEGISFMKSKKVFDII